MAGVLLILLLWGCGQSEEASEKTAQIPEYTVRVVKTYPHLTDAFTQGLVYHDGFLYEGTGQRGESSLRKVRLEDGEVLQEYDLPDRYFGEGVTIVDDRIIQLTWYSQTGFVYDLGTFELVGNFKYLTEGWGLTFDGARLIMSDGTSTLQILDPETYDYVGFIPVRAHGSPVGRLNELEYVDGAILANLWPTERIVRIDPESGEVTGWIDASGLLNREDYTDSVDVLNGIAWDAAGRRLFLTGKYWPKVFEVEFAPSNVDSAIE
jgi:glutamine cyclotransferase